MLELLGRLTALDSSAASDVRVIAYFDALTESQAGLDGHVRGAAALSGCIAGMEDAPHRLLLRVGPDGRRLDPKDLPDDWEARSQHWPARLLDDTGVVRVWLERDADSAGHSDAIVLERLAVGIRSVLARTRPMPLRDDPALIEMMMDANLSVQARERAAHTLGITPGALIRVVASAQTDPARQGQATALPHPLGRWSTPMGRMFASIVPAETLIGSDEELQIGIGPAVAVVDLLDSWQHAKDALYLTAAGTHSDPGYRIHSFDDVGVIGLIARAAQLDEGPTRDLEAIERAMSVADWAPETLEALAQNLSVRQAAAALFVHHSTLAHRLTRLEPALAFEIDSAQGRVRLNVALALRRARRNRMRW